MNNIKRDILKRELEKHYSKEDLVDAILDMFKDTYSRKTILKALDLDEVLKA